MQINKLVKPVITAALLSGAVLVSTATLADSAAPADKQPTARMLCKQKFTDRKSKEYKDCIKEARTKK